MYVQPDRYPGHAPAMPPDAQGTAVVRADALRRELTGAFRPANMHA